MLVNQGAEAFQKEVARHKEIEHNLNQMQLNLQRQIENLNTQVGEKLLEIDKKDGLLAQS